MGLGQEVVWLNGAENACQVFQRDLHKKGTRYAALTAYWAGTTRLTSPVHGYHLRLPVDGSDPSLVGRGQPLFSVVSCKQDKGQSDKQSENKFPHGCALLYPFATCRRIGKKGSRAGPA